jgi:crotonobetainyl-CoA:carnitine CoA-transferase CaiB-like acyl-CoA transferase
MTILRGLRVVEISAGGAAAMAAKHFADWGASVTILEPPDGTPLRHAPPYYEHNGARRSATWAWLSRGKTAVRLDPRAARALCEQVDVVLAESELVPDVLGLPPARVRPWIEGRTTCVLIVPFATDGPLATYRATDLGLVARGGWMSTLGRPDREPLRPGGDMLPRVAGIAAFTAALIALRHAEQGGAPQFVDLSGQAVATSLLICPWLVRSMTGLEGGRRVQAFPGGVVECRDGWVGFTPLTTQQWELLCRMLGFDDVLADPHGLDPAYRQQHGEALHERIRPWLMAHPRRAIVEQAQAWRIPASPVENVAERLTCPQLNARGFFIEAEIDGRTVKVPRVPYLIKGAAPVPRGPLVEGAQQAADRTAIREGAPAAAATPGGSTAALPYHGVRVLDLTHFWAGPIATMLLGALGADVIKVESIQRPDGYRFSLAPTGVERWWERGPLWNGTNSNKRGITLDLSSPRGREIAERLVACSDVVINNFSNRVMANLGLDDARLQELNPRVIAVSLPGYGAGGPWQDFAGWAFPIEHVAVCASITGYPDDKPISMGGFCDPLSGLHAVIAIDLALRRRAVTGKGAVVEAPLCELIDALFAPEHIAVQHGAPVPTRRANRHDWMAPHNAYRVAGEDEWLTIAVASDAEFAALARVLGRPELAADPRFATAAARKAHEAAVDAVIAALVRDRAPPALEAELQAAGVMACRVTKAGRVLDDEGLRHLGVFQEQTRAVIGTHPYFTWPFRFSSIDGRHKRPPPLLGEHNREILTGLVGLSDDELAELEAAGVIGTAPTGLAG